MGVFMREPMIVTACAKEELTSYLGGLIAGLLMLLLAGIFCGVRWCTARGELEASASDTGQRLHVLDNLKFLTMCGVIVCSELQPGDFPVLELEHQSAVRNFLHPAAVRMFCFISGMWSRKPLITGEKSLLVRLGAPLICACFIIQPLDKLFFGPNEWIPSSSQTVFEYMCVAWSSLVVTVDSEPYWYLQALIVWRVLAHLVSPYRVSARFVIAGALAVLGGTAVPENAPFALGQAMVLFPVYMFGQVFPTNTVLSLLPWSQGSALLGCVVLLEVYSLESYSFFALFLTNVPDFHWPGVKYCSPKDLLSFWLLGLFRLTWDMSKGLLVLVFICPRGRCFLSELGKNSLYALLLHRPLVRLTVKILCSLGVPQSLADTVQEDDRSWTGVLSMGIVWFAVIAYAVCLNALISAPQVRDVGKVFVEPYWLDAWLREPPSSEDEVDPDDEDVTLLDCDGGVGDGL